VIFLYIAGGMAGAFSLASIWVHNQGEALILLAFFCTATFGVRQLGYAEFEVARRVLLRGGFRRDINAELAVQAFEQALSAAATPDDCWEEVQRASDEFGFHIVRMRLASRMFGATDYDCRRSSSINISLSEDDWIELSLARSPANHANALVPFATIMQRVLADKTKSVAFRHAPEPGFAPALYGTVPSPVIH